MAAVQQMGYQGATALGLTANSGLRSVFHQLKEMVPLRFSKDTLSALRLQYYPTTLGEETSSSLQSFRRTTRMFLHVAAASDEACPYLEQDQCQGLRKTHTHTHALAQAPLFSRGRLPPAASLNISEMTPHFHKGIRNSLDFLSQLIIAWV